MTGVQTCALPICFPVTIRTKDRVTIAKFFDLKDVFKNVGAQTIKQAAAVTAQEAGDGTTTSTVLAASIMREAQKFLVAGASPADMKRGMEGAVLKIVEELASKAKPISSIEDIEHIATISANGDHKIGKLIANAVDKVGKDGAISIEAGKSVDTSLEIIEVVGTVVFVLGTIRTVHHDLSQSGLFVNTNLSTKCLQFLWGN